MKKMFLFIFLIFNFNLYATVFDFIKNKNEFLFPFVLNEVRDIKVKINDSKMEILLQELNKSSQEVLDILYKNAEKEGCIFYNDETILNIANLLYEIAGRKKYNEEFGYVFYKDKNNKITFVITASDGRSCEIIKITTKQFKNKNIKGYEDGIKHFNDAEKIFSIEISSGRGNAIYFANFYRINSGDRCEIRNFYNNTFKKDKYKILKKYFSETIDFFMIEKGDKNYLLVISEKENENWIFVTG